MADAFGAFEGIKEVSNEWDANRNKRDELRADVCEGSMKTIKYTNQKKFISEHRLEELSNLRQLSLLPKRRIEEDILD